tara:strand:- start:480 stop:1193 length:714 start_codon:yes stop_codon:yes gene_type:complete
MMAKAVGVPDLDQPERTFTGHARERAGDSKIHEHNHAEIAETSAVGRMLAFAGFGADGSIASADEVQREDARDGPPVQREGVTVGHAAPRFESATTPMVHAISPPQNPAPMRDAVLAEAIDMSPPALAAPLRKLYAMDSVPALLEAAPKIAACADVGTYTKEDAARLLLFAFVRCEALATEPEHGRTAVKALDDTLMKFAEPINDIGKGGGIETLRRQLLAKWEPEQETASTEGAPV